MKEEAGIYLILHLLKAIEFFSLIMLLEKIGLSSKHLTPLANYLLYKQSVPRQNSECGENLGAVQILVPTLQTKKRKVLTSFLSHYHTNLRRHMILNKCVCVFMHMYTFQDFEIRKEG